MMEPIGPDRAAPAAALENTGIYYDWSARRPLTTADGCSFAEWPQVAGRYAFARHPDGFLVFLPSDRLTDEDEYAPGASYSLQSQLDQPFHRRRAQCTSELLAEALQEASAARRVLDVGCGAGHVTSYLRAAHPQAEFLGLDHSVSAIRHAKEAYPGIEFVVADGFAPPFPPDYFDVVVCNNLWEHLTDPIRLLEAAGRVTRPGGFFILSTPSRYRMGNVLRVLARRPVRFVSPLHVTEYSVGQVCEQLRFGGYEPVRVHSRPIAAGSYPLKFRVVHAVFKPPLWVVARILGLRHSLEETVFFLARRGSRPSVRTGGGAE